MQINKLSTFVNEWNFDKSHTSKLNQQKQWYVVSKSAAYIYLPSKYETPPPYLIIDQSRNTFQHKFCAERPRTFKPNSALLQLQVCDLNHTPF